MSASDDQADVERVLAGHIDAFESIVRRWQGPLVNLAFRFCRDRSRSEELAQEAFLRAYRALSQWRKDAAFSTWLFALATNLYRTEIRRVPSNVVPIDSILEPHSRETIADGDQEDTVKRAVSTLPPKYRDALILFYFHEMDVSAAAESLNLPEGTLKARLSRGRDLLRDKLTRPVLRFRKSL